MTRLWMLTVLILLCFASQPAAKRYKHTSDAWGFYVSPTTSKLNHAPSRYELFQSNTAEDFGIYYSHHLTRGLSVQIETRFDVREADIEWGFSSLRIHEEFVEFPFLIHMDRWHSVYPFQVRIFVGAGISYRILIEQELASKPLRELPCNCITPIGFNGYQKIAWVMDGGGTLIFNRRSGVFVSYRITNDWGTLGESDDVTVLPKYFSFGFQIGLEFRFGS